MTVPVAVRDETLTTCIFGIQVENLGQEKDSMKKERSRLQFQAWECFLLCFDLLMSEDDKHLPTRRLSENMD